MSPTTRKERIAAMYGKFVHLGYAPGTLTYLAAVDRIDHPPLGRSR